MKNGVDAGRRRELTGGGLISSVGGWKLAKTILKGQARVKGDERILGDSDFIDNVLARSNEYYTRRHRLLAQGVDLGALSHAVADYFDLSSEQLYTPGRYPAVVQDRSILCFLAVRALGVTATELARQMGLTQPAISMSVKRSEGLVKEKKLSIDDFLA